MDDGSEKQRVLIFTRQFEITGNLHILYGVRLTDYMNESKEFIALTDVEVKRPDSEAVVSSSFLNINKADIEIIMPAHLVTQTTP